MRPLGYKVTLDEGVYTVKLPKVMKRPYPHRGEEEALEAQDAY